MAIENEIRDLVSAIERLIAATPSRGSGSTGGASSKLDLPSIRKSMEDIQKLGQTASSTNVTLETRRQAEKLYSASLRSEADRIGRSAQTLEDKLAEAGETAKQLAGDNKDYQTQLEKSLQAQVRQTDAVERNRERTERLSAGVEKVKTAFDPLSKAIGSVAGAYQNSGSQVGAAGTLLQAQTQLIGGSLSQVGTGAQSLGTSLMAGGKSAQKFGSILQVAGLGLNLFGSGLSSVAQKILPFLTGELEKAVTSFQSLSSSGALFADGITGMKNAGKDAGLDLQQFSSVIKQNSATIADAGLGMTEGAKRIGAAFKADEKTGGKMREQLTRLGFTYEEQAGLVAETMSQMKRTGQSMQADPQQIAAQTAKYAENLRVIAAITGEDAKKKQAQVAEENKKLIVAQKLNSLDETTRSNVILAQQNMSDTQRKAFNEMLTFGRVVTPELAATMSQMPNLQASVDDAFAAFQAGQLDDVKMREINKQRGDAIAAEINANMSIAQANYVGASQLTTAIGESMASELQFRRANTAEAIAAAEAAARAQKEKPKEGPDLTGSVLEVIKAQQDFKLAVQEQILTKNVLGNFADAVKSATENITSAINTFGGAAGAATGTFTGALSSVGETALAVVTGAGALASIVSAFKGGGGGATPTPGAGTGRGVGGFFGRMLGLGGGVVAAETAALGGAAGAATTAGAATAAGTAGAAGTTAGATGAAGAGASRTAGFLSGAARIGTGLLKGVGGLVGGLALDYGADTAKEKGYEKTGASLSTASSALTGASIGATLGSVVPVVGTAAGGIVGGALGGAYGLYQNLGSFFSKSPTAPAPVPATPAETGGRTPVSQNAPAAATEMAATIEQQRAVARATTPTENVSRIAAREEAMAASMTEMNQGMQQMLARLDEMVEQLRNVSSNTQQTVVALR